MLLIVWRIEVGRSGSTVSQDIGNKLTRPSILSHSSFRLEWSRPAGWQPINLGEDENVREVPAETIPEDILKCDKAHWETIFLKACYLSECVCLSVNKQPFIQKLNFKSPTMHAWAKIGNVMLVRINTDLSFLFLFAIGQLKHY